MSGARPWLAAPFALSLCLGLGARQVAAQSRRPLVTEDLTMLAAGRAELRLAAGVDQAFVSPSLPLEGTLVTAPEIALGVGLGSRVEAQLFFVPFQVFSPAGERARRSVGDVTLATKVRLVSARRAWPGIAFRYAVKLPNAGESTGIGSDETDFLAELLFGRPLGRGDIWCSAGLLILGNPAVPASQDDLLRYGLAMDWPIAWGRAAAELEGRAGPGVPDRTTVRAGASFALWGQRLDASLSYTSSGERGGAGLRLGWTRAFRLFSDR